MQLVSSFSLERECTFRSSTVYWQRPISISSLMGASLLHINLRPILYRIQTLQLQSRGNHNIFRPSKESRNVSYSYMLNTFDLTYFRSVLTLGGKGWSQIRRRPGESVSNSLRQCRIPTTTTQDQARSITQQSLCFTQWQFLFSSLLTSALDLLACFVASALQQPGYPALAPYHPFFHYHSIGIGPA